jgi:hypothetical protein
VVEVLVLVILLATELAAAVEVVMVVGIYRHYTQPLEPQILAAVEAAAAMTAHQVLAAVV